MFIPFLERNQSPAADAARSGARFEIVASCRFWWTAREEQAHFGTGRISNVSVTGVSVSSAVLPTIGSSIMLEIDLPRSSRVGLPAESSLLLAAEGRVLRHHPKGEGFAARLTHASFTKDQCEVHD